MTMTGRKYLGLCLGLLCILSWESRADVVCPDGDTLQGIDVSLFNGVVNWSSVAADGIEFVYVRQSNGLTADNSFATNWEGARAAGITRGAYQVLQPDEDAIAQAQLLIDAVVELSPGDLSPALAVESTAGQSPATIVTKVGQWLDHVESNLGLPPVIYTGRFFWMDNVGSSNYADHPLWIADYSSSTCPNLPTQWTDWVFWQDSSTGSVNGITGNVNTNLFNGDLADLAELGQPVLCNDELCLSIFENGFESQDPPADGQVDQ